MHVPTFLCLVVASRFDFAAAWTVPGGGASSSPSSFPRGGTSATGISTAKSRTNGSIIDDVGDGGAPRRPLIDRRDALSRTATLTFGIVGGSTTSAVLPNAPAWAYTPDPDPVRESLYFVSRVQEATVQQERFVRRTSNQEDLKQKMKLTLRLVEKNYRLLDQINFLSSYVSPADALVTATAAGFEAADALQSAIDYVKTDLGTGPLRDEQRVFLTTALSTCREELFAFLAYVPKDKLDAARKRVEEENAANREEYDGDGTEGVYNPVVLPWKDRQ